MCESGYSVVYGEKDAGKKRERERKGNEKKELSKLLRLFGTSFAHMTSGLSLCPTRGLLQFPARFIFIVPFWPFHFPILFLSLSIYDRQFSSFTVYTETPTSLFEQDSLYSKCLYFFVSLVNSTIFRIFPRFSRLPGS